MIKSAVINQILWLRRFYHMERCIVWTHILFRENVQRNNGKIRVLGIRCVSSCARVFFTGIYAATWDCIALV